MDILVIQLCKKLNLVNSIQFLLNKSIKMITETTSPLVSTRMLNITCNCDLKSHSLTIYLDNIITETKLNICYKYNSTCEHTKNTQVCIDIWLKVSGTFFVSFDHTYLFNEQYCFIDDDIHFYGLYVESKKSCTIDIIRDQIIFECPNIENSNILDAIRFISDTVNTIAENISIIEGVNKSDILHRINDYIPMREINDSCRSNNNHGIHQCIIIRKQINASLQKYFDQLKFEAAGRVDIPISIDQIIEKLQSEEIQNKQFVLGNITQTLINLKYILSTDHNIEIFVDRTKTGDRTKAAKPIKK